MTEEERIQKEIAFKQGMSRLASEPIKAEGYVSPLVNDVMVAKGQKPATDTAKHVIKDATQHIDTKNIGKIISGNQFKDKLAKILESRAAARAGKMLGQAGEIASSVGKKVPILGGLAVGLGTALATGDVSAGEQAATPLLNEAEDLGPTEGTLEHKLESGTISPAEREILARRFSK